MSGSDTLQRFLIENKNIRGELVHLKNCIRTAFEHVEYPTAVKTVLGQALAAAAMLSATIKFEGRLSLQIQGKGPMHLLLVQVTHDRKIRGMAKWAGTITTEGFRDLVGNAQFAITIEPEKGQRYQGIVPLEGENLSECLEAYFLNSEQLPTQIWLASDEAHAAGFMIQVLPGHDEPGRPEDWEHISILAKSLTDRELLTLPNETILYRLFHGEAVRMFDSQEIAFQCVCSKQKCEEAVLSLGKEEIESMIEESKPVEMKCEFCGADYQLDIADLNQLLNELKSTTNR